jgi:hypothetical protein
MQAGPLTAFPWGKNKDETQRKSQRKVYWGAPAETIAAAI